MQLRHRPWIALLACVAATGAVRAQEGAAATAPAPAAETPAPSAPASGLGLNWRVPPISTSGSVSYDLRASHAPGENTALSQLVTSTLSARTYIYQPWFATLNGSVSVSLSRSQGGGLKDTSEAPFASQEGPGTMDRFVTGNARLDLFPRSRFPFEMHFERSDSRVDSGLASSLDFRTQNLGFSQRYRPPSGNFSASGSFDRRQQFGVGFRDTQDALTGEFSTRWKYNEASAGLSYNQAQRDQNDDRTQFLSLVGHHQYSPAGGLSVTSTANATKTREHVGVAETDLSVLQLSSVGIWRPDGSKLTLSGAVRGLVLRDSISDNALDTAGLTLGTSYELNRNARLTANANVTTSNSNGTVSQGFSGTAGASWQGDSLEFNKFRYDWFASGSVGASGISGGSNSASETQTTLDAQLGHTINRTWPLTEFSNLQFNAGQTLNSTYTRSSSERHIGDASIPTSARSLLHTAGTSWNIAGDNRSASARAMFSDTREIGGGNGQFQLFNFQLTGTFQFGRDRSLSGDLTYQRSAQRAGDQTQPSDIGPIFITGERTSSHGASGEIVYRQQRLLGIPRLRFTSRLKLARDVQSQAGTFATIADRETRLWENRLDWAAGRLETQLIFRLTQVEGKRREYLMWRVQRNFGD